MYNICFMLGWSLVTLGEQYSNSTSTRGKEGVRTSLLLFIKSVFPCMVPTDGPTIP